MRKLVYRFTTSPRTNTCPGMREGLEVVRGGDRAGWLAAPPSEYDDDEGNENAPLWHEAEQFFNHCSWPVDVEDATNMETCSECSEGLSGDEDVLPIDEVLEADTTAEAYHSGKDMQARVDAHTCVMVSANTPHRASRGRTCNPNARAKSTVTSACNPIPIIKTLGRCAPPTRTTSSASCCDPKWCGVLVVPSVITVLHCEKIFVSFSHCTALVCLRGVLFLTFSEATGVYKAAWCISSCDTFCGLRLALMCTCKITTQSPTGTWQPGPRPRCVGVC